MSKERTASFPPEPHEDFSAVLAQHMEALDRGEGPDRNALLARYPHFAERLRAYFSDLDRIEQFARPIRNAELETAESLAYEVLEEISRGGMGVVLRCRDRVLDRDLAIKVLLDHYRDQPALVRRFIEEARITGQLQHPFIVPVHKLGTLEDGRPYFAMKLVQGRTLAELLRERASPAEDLPRYLHVFEQICQTIAYAHSKGVIHRDLKPANVMVGHFGEVQVMDWGLAKILDDAPPDSDPPLPGTPGRGVRGEGDEAADGLSPSPPPPLPGVPGRGEQTAAGAVLGTYAYMPPEQAAGELAHVNRRSDVFGLGAILCEILTGLPPYTGDLSEIRARARLGNAEDARQRLDSCAADSELIELAKCCLAKTPEERPPDGAAVSDAIARYSAAVQERMRAAEIARARAETEAVEERKRVVLAEAKALAERRRSKAETRRRRATLVMMASLSLLLCVATAFGLWYQRLEWRRQSEGVARQTATERDVAAALAEVRLRRQEGLQQVQSLERWKLTLSGAWEALRRAENALNLGAATPNLQAEVKKARELLQQDERDRNFFLTLERRWLELNAFSLEDVRAPREASFAIRAFKDYGLDLGADDPKKIAALVRQHPQKARLVEEIANVEHFQAALGAQRQRIAQFGFRGVTLSKIDWSKSEKLRHILDAIEDDPQAFGTRWRAARLKNDNAALIHLSQTIDQDDLSPRSAVALANDLTAVGAFEHAHNILHQAHERQPTDFFLNQMLGVISMIRTTGEQGQSFDRAIGYLKTALAIRGHNPASHMILTQIYKAQGDSEAAFRSAQAAIDADPESAPAHHNLGNLHHDKKEWDKALACFQRAADLDNVSALPMDALGQCWFEKGDCDKALHYYEIAIAREPNFAGPYLNKANALARKNDIDGAIAQYRKSLDLFPNYGLAHNNLGGALASKKEIPAAIRSFKTAIECDPNLTQAYYALGDTLLIYYRDQEGAIKAYEGPVRQFPKNATVHFQLAALLQRLGRNFQAVDSYRKVVEINPKFPEVHARLGVALAALGQWDGAIVEYKAALEQLDPKGPALVTATLYNYMGTAHGKLEQWDKALQCYQAALNFDPLRGAVDANIGLVHQYHWQLEEAEKAYRAALKQDPKNAGFHRDLAWVLLEMGDHDGCSMHARKSLEISPDQPEPYTLLAQVCMEKGDPKACAEMASKGKALLRSADPDIYHVKTVSEFSEKFAWGAELLPAFFRGEMKPADVVEKNTLALVAGLKEHRYAQATQLLQESFTADPVRADNVMMGGRWRGVCFALKAARGEGVEAPQNEAERSKLRNLALDWLRADLHNWKRVQNLVGPTDQGFPRFRVRLWFKEPALAQVREPNLAQLPEREREDWTKIWADIAAFAANQPSEPKLGLDVAKLRKLADMPAISFMFNINYNSATAKRDNRGYLIDPAKKIELLQSQLTGDLDDADRWIEMVWFYVDLKQEEKAQELARKAEERLRPFLQSNDPKEVGLMLSYADIYRFLHPEKHKEIESWLRRAVELAPQDWQAWQRLGNAHHVRTNTAILGRLPDRDKHNEAKEWLIAGKATATAIAEAEKALAEARKCFDRAKQLAPAEEKQWNARIVFLLNEAEWGNIFRVAHGQRPLPVETPPPSFKEVGFKGGTSLSALPELQAECIEAAERCPNHIGMQVFGLINAIPAIKNRLQERDPLKDKSPLLAPHEKRALHEIIARIEKIRESSTGEASLYCDRVLACMLFNLMALDDDFGPIAAKVQPMLRRLIAADPKDSEASMFLEVVLVDSGNPMAGLELAKQRFKNDPSIRNHYRLARAYEYCDQPEQAAKELDAALVNAPNDPDCLAGRAALWIRHGDEKDLEKAGQYLDKARLNLLPDSPKDRFEDIEYLQAIHKILSGHPVIGRLCLDYLRSTNQHDKRYKQALEAAGP